MSVLRDDGTSNGGGEYCICRGPDDYQTMIACDHCDEWYHCACVDVKEYDILLIDKYICGKCHVPAVRFSTWKPMCRLASCRQPCDLTTNPPSKYCTLEHKRRFWQDAIARAPDSPEQSYGGALTKQELKALLDFIKGDINAFHNLGKRPTLSIPVEHIDWRIILNNEERGRLDEIIREKTKLGKRRQGFENKREVVQMAIVRLNEELSGICGWDKRLAMNEEEFDRWRNTEAGIEAFKIGRLCGTLCGKKWCTRHKGWVEFGIGDINFELDQVTKALDKLLAEEHAIKERAQTRAASCYTAQLQ